MPETADPSRGVSAEDRRQLSNKGLLHALAFLLLAHGSLLHRLALMCHRGLCLDELLLHIQLRTARNGTTSASCIRVLRKSTDRFWGSVIFQQGA